VKSEQGYTLLTQDSHFLFFLFIELNIKICLILILKKNLEELTGVMLENENVDGKKKKTKTE